MEKEIRIPRMDCEGCAETVEKALRNLFDVQGFSVDVPAQRIRVTYRSPEDWKGVVHALRNVGFPPE